ncbi:hypothetical protein I203_102051 [Kwoniella mangroviensis CBS 8507]|uniref:uncharacterized protein n=1 Tax=Kwoniella mangroviensis CBS 8507 TaxID=1296122 RepID=UPI00303DF3BF
MFRSTALKSLRAPLQAQTQTRSFVSKAQLVGRLGAAPEKGTTSGGQDYYRYSLAVTKPGKRDAEGSELMDYRRLFKRRHHIDMYLLLQNPFLMNKVTLSENHPGSPYSTSKKGLPRLLRNYNLVHYSTLRPKSTPSPLPTRRCKPKSD